MVKGGKQLSAEIDLINIERDADNRKRHDSEIPAKLLTFDRLSELF